ncbi:MAG: hypothetical protein DRP57_10170, partial [Spirochaetes bacterium]
FADVSESELFSQAEREYTHGNYTLALEDYNLFVKEYPLSDLIPDVQYRKAVSLFRLGKLNASLALFREIEKRYRYSRYFDYVPFWEGIILYDNKNYSESIDSLEAFLARVKESSLRPQAYLYEALSLVSIADNRKAKLRLEELIEQYPENSNRSYALVLMSSLLLQDKEYRKVIEYNKKYPINIIEEKWKEQYSLYRAEAMWGIGEYDKAKDIYRGLRNSKPEISSVAFRRLFSLAQKNKNFSTMESITQQAEEKFAGSPEALKDLWLRFGIESFKRGNLDLAEHFLKRLWNMRNREIPEAAGVLYLAEISIKKKNLKEAESILSEYTKLTDQTDPAVVMRLGDVYVMEKNYLNAARYYLEFTENFPDSPRLNEAQYLLAYAYYSGNKLSSGLKTAEKLISKNKIDKYYIDAVKLKAIILKKQKKYREARDTIKEYISFSKKDIKAHLDLIKLSFILKDYGSAVEQTNNLLKLEPSLKNDDLSAYILTYYIKGLSEIMLKSYSKAIKSLAYVSEKQLKEVHMETLYPFVLYYTGWAYYRLGGYQKALDFFSIFAGNFKNHVLYVPSLYMAGWCAFSLGSFKESADYFSNLSGIKDKSLAVKADYLKGKSLENLKDTEGAESVFRFIFNKFPMSEFADDSMFEYAGLLAESGKVDSAAKVYLDLAARYPDSPLKEDAIYKRAEIYFGAGMYGKAEEAFYDYRLKFPKGKLFDAALYWGGYSAYKLGEAFGAVLLWENLISDYKSSPFTPDAMQKTAQVYEKKGRYKEALNLYAELIAEYPQEASVAKAKEKADQLRYPILGLSDKEAKLSAKIGEEGGAKTKGGREAIIALARIYIADQNKIDLAFRMLEEVIKKNDPETSSRAQYLIGEYYYRKGDLIKAGKEFLKAAFLNPKDKDLMAMSIYRAAEMMKLSGKTEDLKNLVERLKNNFPGTQWAEEGEKLLKGVKK